jgi:HEPN domain-containing protein
VPSISRVSCCTGVADSGGARPSAAEAARWLAKAEEDLAVAQLLVRTDSPVRWAACFHSQQAAEKAIKSPLVLAGVDFPRSHALGRLVALLPEGAQCRFDDEALAALDPWATAGRYPEDVDEPDESTTTRIVATAAQIVDTARALQI